ncbi:MAG TPA: DUF2497 domain-containing protein [Rhizomicrobium sp.]|jgi:hypothetical protein|nr:DUF2497 domain-containing protein [Rhizomicrobium sp.]
MASSPQHEPTMEEILASIRKIISEDAPEAKTEAAPAPAPAMEADVLELTQEVPAEPEPQPEPEPVAEEPAPPEPEPEPVQEVVFQPDQEEPAVSSSAPGTSNQDIFSDKTRGAIDKAFDKLNEMPDEPEAPQPRVAAPAPRAAADGDSVEAVFERAVNEAFGPHLEQWMDGRKDEILASVKPLIREWMDEHFPALLEGAVRDEVARAVKARGRR